MEEYAREVDAWITNLRPGCTGPHEELIARMCEQLTSANLPPSADGGMKADRSQDAKRLRNLVLQRVKGAMLTEAVQNYDEVARPFCTAPSLYQVSRAVTCLRAVQQSTGMTVEHAKLALPIGSACVEVLSGFSVIPRMEDGVPHSGFEHLSDLCLASCAVEENAQVRAVATTISTILDVKEAVISMKRSADYATKLPVVTHKSPALRTLSSDIDLTKRLGVSKFTGGTFSRALADIIASLERDAKTTGDVLNSQQDAEFARKIKALDAACRGVSDSKSWREGATTDNIVDVFGKTLERVNF